MFISADIPDAILRGVVLSIVGILWVVALIRLVGLRSFSKMTGFDFVVTLAVGSLLATGATVSSWPSFIQAMVAIGAVLACQYVLAILRRQSRSFRDTVENTPVILMRNGEFVDNAMRKTRVSQDDVIAKLREANALDRSKVQAVILESTGDISVLHGDSMDDRLLNRVHSYGEGAGD